MIKKVLFAAGCLGLLAFAYILFGLDKDLEVNDQKYKYTVANTEAERTRGLSGRENLPEDEVLVFVFDNLGSHAIWMKDMNFAIDVVWLDKNKQVVDIEKNLTPETYPKSFQSDIDARYVVEMASGATDKLQLKLTDKFSFDESTD